MSVAPNKKGGGANEFRAKLYTIQIRTPLGHWGAIGRAD
jgi:hypothetical protein